MQTTTRHNKLKNAMRKTWPRIGCRALVATESVDGLSITLELVPTGSLDECLSSGSELLALDCRCGNGESECFSRFKTRFGDLTSERVRGKGKENLITLKLKTDLLNADGKRTKIHNFYARVGVGWAACDPVVDAIDFHPDPFPNDRSPEIEDPED